MIDRTWLYCRRRRRCCRSVTITLWQLAKVLAAEGVQVPNQTVWATPPYRSTKHMEQFLSYQGVVCLLSSSAKCRYSFSSYLDNPFPSYLIKIFYMIHWGTAIERNCSNKRANSTNFTNFREVCAPLSPSYKNIMWIISWLIVNRKPATVNL